jgi:hypothetical protein
MDKPSGLQNCFELLFARKAEWWGIEAGDWNGNKNKNNQISCINEINMWKSCIFLNRYVIIITLDSIKLCALSFDFQ